MQTPPQGSWKTPSRVGGGLGEAALTGQDELLLGQLGARGGEEVELQQSQLGEVGGDTGGHGDTHTDTVRGAKEVN